MLRDIKTVASNRTRSSETHPGARRYADDQETFFTEYAAAHEKLSELGVTWPSSEGEREEE